MKVRRVLGALIGSVLALTLMPAGQAAASAKEPALSAVTVPGQPKVAGRAAPGSVLVSQSGTLTSHPSGGVGTTPGTRLSRATVKVDVYSGPTYFPSASVQLQGAPGSTEGRVRLAFGHLNGSTCTLSTAVGSTSTSGSTTSYSINGGYNPDYFATPSRPWTCAAVEYFDATGTTRFDAVVGRLVDKREAPRLRVGKVEVLGRAQGRLRLVRGAWTPVHVTVRNTGKVKSKRVRLVGRGPGLKVKRAAMPALAPGKSASVKVQVRLVGARKRSRLQLTANAAGVRATRRIPVARVGAPPRPVAGRYSSPNGEVRFTIRQGRVVGWAGTMRTQCGSPPGIPTSTTNTYDFPRVRIPRNGILEASAGGSNYGTSLRMQVSGRRVTRGSFTFTSTAPCRASVTFTARRVGR